VSDRYDDGGISGGTMVHPALQRLLRDIRERRVDVVVVYKIDRLGNLYYLLSNPVYIGKIRHRDEVYDGEHLPIVEPDVFSKAQALLGAQAPRRTKPDNADGTHLLTGILFDETGDRLSPTYVNKNGKRYRYYVSNRLVRARKNSTDGWRVPARQIESLVEDQLRRLFSNKVQLADWIQETGTAYSLELALGEADRIRGRYEIGSPAEKVHLLRIIFRRVELSQNALSLEVNRTAVVTALTASQSTLSSCRSVAAFHLHEIAIPLTLHKRGVETKLHLTNGLAASSFDPALIALIARAAGVDC
jgi:site-specific DNA recombinase